MASAKRTSTQKLRVIVLGYVVRRPFGGQVWHYLQYVLGLKQLGHDVYYMEDSGDFADCYDPESDSIGWDPATGLQFLDSAMKQIGLSNRWAYRDSNEGQWLGPIAERVTELCDSAEMIINVSGLTTLRPWFVKIPHRVLIDTDPVFSQIRHLTTEPGQPWSGWWHQDSVSRHTAFFSFAENVRKPTCTMPDDDLPWQPTRQPCVLDAWPVTAGPRQGRLTTVMQWRPYSSLHYEGKRYGIKSDSFASYLDLPKKVGSKMELAILGDSAPKEKLSDRGWVLTDPREEVATADDYRRYIQSSKAEFAVAKHAYVEANTGWFSERSVNYLASGRPTIVQDTGFTENLETEGGILPFTSAAEAVDAIEDALGRYDFHCAAARDSAVEHFDSKKVLSELVENSTATSPPPGRA